MRLTIQELIRVCNAVSESMHADNGVLTDDECEMVLACIHTLKGTVLPDLDDEARLAAALRSIPTFNN